MRRGRGRALAMALMVFPIAAGHALNAASMDILGLRLGMAEPQVAAILLRQGIPQSRITRNVGACQGQPGCNVTIMAPTRDGQVSVGLARDEADAEASPVVAQIVYTLKGTQPNEAPMIRSSVLERFGPPDQASPMTWCQGPTKGICRPEQPSLQFSPESLTLVLKAATLKPPTTVETTK